MKVIDILEAVGIDGRIIAAEFQDRLEYDVMIREGDSPFLFHKLSIQRVSSGNRLIIQVGDQVLRDPWKG